MKIVADRFIPFLQGRLEPFADITYIHPDDFSPSTIQGADALLIRTRTKCGAPLLAGSSVKMIATATIGMDQFDLPWCKENGIATFNSPGCNAPAVAQYVWSALLHIGIDPKKTVIGVVGHGNVGTIVADWGRLLGATVLLCDPLKQEKDNDRYMSLDELAAQADVVTLHTPLTHTGLYPTFHMVDATVISKMKKGAVLVNAARGPVVDSAAVAQAAEKGLIRLVTDTWEGEPYSLHPVILKKSEIATPHIAGYSLQGKQRATRMILQALASEFKIPINTDPANIITPGEAIQVADLPAPYTPWSHITEHDIFSSYDPVAETMRLKADPSCFETWRDSYVYRQETIPK